MFAVIFSNARTDNDPEGYGAMATRMEALAATQPGYIGFESARNPDGTGIAVSYWETEADIEAWKTNAEHLLAQQHGQTDWYHRYTTHVAEISRSYSFPT